MVAVYPALFNKRLLLLNYKSESLYEANYNIRRNNANQLSTAISFESASSFLFGGKCDLKTKTCTGGGGGGGGGNLRSVPSGVSAVSKKSRGNDGLFARNHVSERQWYGNSMVYTHMFD